MTEGNMALWDAWKSPPPDALKRITGGRLSGKTDISPIWRMEVLTQELGPYGVGWKYEIVDRWVEEGAGGEKAQFVQVNLYIGETKQKPSGPGLALTNVAWSVPIPGVGGAMLIAKEKGGLYLNDEAVKMALTDALSVSMKALGVAADVYRGLADTKYLAQTHNQNGSVSDSQPRGAPHPASEGQGTDPEVQALLATVWARLTEEFGDYPPWQDEKAAALKLMFGTSNIKSIKSRTPDSIRESLKALDGAVRMVRLKGSEPGAVAAKAAKVAVEKEGTGEKDPSESDPSGVF